MKSLAHALDSAVPRFQQFGMRQSQLAPANEFALLLLAQFVRVIPEQFPPILLEPNRQSLSLVKCQTKNCAFQLFQAHSPAVYQI